MAVRRYREMMDGIKGLSKTYRLGDSEVHAIDHADLAIDEGGWTCGKDGQSVPVGVGCPTIKISAITVGGNFTDGNDGRVVATVMNSSEPSIGYLM